MTALVLDHPIGADVGADASAACIHCGGPVFRGRRFCCPGCESAFAVVQDLGLEAYYLRRILDPAARRPRPEVEERHDLDRYVQARGNGEHELTLAVDGLQCGACVWLIESVLSRDPSVRRARINLTTRQLTLCWQGASNLAEYLVARVEALGYRLIAFDAAALTAARDKTQIRLLRALAVAGFAAGNVMLLSLGMWWGLGETMGPATRSLLQWVSALIALPAISYAGMPFFGSAARALRQRRTNMDVPVSVGVVLVTAMSLVETMRGGEHTYFESATALLFFLLIGRVLDARARGTARATAEQLLALRHTDVTVRDADGSIRRMAAEAVVPGAEILVGAGERIGIDGIVISGESHVDASMVSGESAPVPIRAGDSVFAGTLNLGASLTLRVTATGAGTLLAECARLITAAEARHGRYVVLADRVARSYAPVVHALALLTFLGWIGWWDASWNDALLAAAAVLIITCPCALSLAVPAVQVIAATRLFRSGILLKSATALERLAAVDTVVFDKTGTLTRATPCLTGTYDRSALQVAASLAAASRHPLARALVADAGKGIIADGVLEHPGSGLVQVGDDGETRLGNRTFCGVVGQPTDGPELWLVRPGHTPCCFTFSEALREDAAVSLRQLQAAGLDVHILSGDRPEPVRRIADILGINNWRAGLTPPEKVAVIEGVARDGRKVLMVGDGLNDGPALAAASVSASPSSAADISQNVADIVFQGDLLNPVVEILWTARRAARVMRQNLAFALAYNALLVPLAMMGWMTPWLAAAAMSTSSLAVIGNSFRLRRAGGA